MPVAADFHAMRDHVVASVDSKFAETVRLSPMKDGRADPDRPQVSFNAVLRTGAEGESGSNASISRQGLNSRLAAAGGDLSIDRTRYPEITIRKGDKIRALARPGEPVFEVLFVNDRDHTRLIAKLGEA